VPDGPLEAALDELYGTDPAEFVTVRKRLAATLREGGDKADAKVLQAARRPSTSAWALNQLARSEPDLVESLLDASSALYAAQTRGSNQPDVLRDAIRAHREALDAATDAATAVLGPRANDSFRNEIVSTLRAVSTDEETQRQLRTGRLIREASSSGFPDAVGLTLVPELRESTSSVKPKAGVAPRGAKRAPDRREESQAAAEAEREREARRRADLAARESARKDADAAIADADRAQARVEELEGEVQAARRELTNARARSRTAKSKLRDLR
jgi:hypothetical protein